MEKIAEINKLKASEKFEYEKSIDELTFDMVDEAAEVIKAVKEYKRKPIRANRLHLAYELADVQFTCETAMSSLGFSQMGRDSIRLDVAKGNEECGYYDSKLPDAMYVLFCKYESGATVYLGTYSDYDSMVNEYNRVHKEKDKRSFFFSKCSEVATIYDAECGF